FVQMTSSRVVPVRSSSAAVPVIVHSFLAPAALLSAPCTNAGPTIIAVVATATAMVRNRMWNLPPHEIAMKLSPQDIGGKGGVNQTGRENGPSRRSATSGAHPGVDALFDLTEPLNDAREHRDRDLRAAIEELAKLLRRNLQGFDALRGLHGREPLARRDQRHLSEEVARFEAVEPAADVHLGGARNDDVHPVGGVPLLHDRGAGLERRGLRHAQDLVDRLR